MRKGKAEHELKGARPCTGRESQSQNRGERPNPHDSEHYATTAMDFFSVHRRGITVRQAVRTCAPPRLATPVRASPSFRPLSMCNLAPATRRRATHKKALRVLNA